MTNLLLAAAPGELTDVDDEPNPLPHLGGCGQALIVAADFFAGYATADTHLESCAACRDALITLGRRASGIEWLCGTDTETPHTAPPASIAA